jgi:hypothetical protein
LNGLVQVAEFDGELSHFAQGSRAGDQDIRRDEVDCNYRRRVSKKNIAVMEGLADAQEDSDARSSAALAP